MVDVFASLPGRGSVEVEREVSSPLEKAFWSIPGVEYVYSTSSPGSAFVVVRFRVGEDPDRALVRVRAKLDALADVWPRDVPPPLVKPRSIDDVPIWALTFWSPTQDSATLRQIAAEVENEIKTHPGSLGHRADRRPAARVSRRARSGAARGARARGRRGPRGDRGGQPAHRGRRDGRRRPGPRGRGRRLPRVRARARVGRGRRARRAPGAPRRRRDRRRRARTARVLRDARGARPAGALHRRHARRQQAPGRQRDLGRACDRAQARRPASRACSPPTSGRR